jgi:hypothetical protein
MNFCPIFVLRVLKFRVLLLHILFNFAQSDIKSDIIYMACILLILTIRQIEAHSNN